MIRRLLPPSLLALSVGAAAPPAPDTETFAGHYTVKWEMMAFSACGSKEAWWVADAGQLGAGIREVLDDDAGYGTVYARVRGRLSEPGPWGHMGGYRRMLSVDSVLEVRRAERDDCRRRREVVAE